MPPVSDNSVVFDLKALKEMKRLPVAEDCRRTPFRSPGGPGFHPERRRAFLHPDRAADANRGANIPLGGKPEYGSSASDGTVSIAIPNYQARESGGDGSDGSGLITGRPGRNRQGVQY